MSIENVKFSYGYSIGNQGASRRNEGKAEEKQTTTEASKNGVQQSNPEQVLNALDIAGLQNKSQINRVEAKEINPADYLSAERIADIEAAMGDFELRVNQFAQAIENELPGFFAADEKFALGAHMASQE